MPETSIAIYKIYLHKYKFALVLIKNLKNLSYINFFIIFC